MSNQVSILIPTRNRAAALEAVWSSYSRIPDAAEIIVVDDASTDNTSALVEELARASSIPVRLIRHESRQGQQASRMSAIDAASQTWVLFGEDDVWLDTEYCATLLAEAQSSGAAAVAGRLITARVPGIFDPAALEDTTPLADADCVVDMNMLDADFAARTRHAIAVPFLHTIALIRRDVFSRIEFDSGYGGNGWREETDFYLGLANIGEKVVFTPDARCWHLRGPISASGGQRIPRWRIEYHAFANTLRLVRKHWQQLSGNFGFRGTPLTWTALFMARRERMQAGRWLQGHRSSFRT